MYEQFLGSDAYYDRLPKLPSADVMSATQKAMALMSAVECGPYGDSCDAGYACSNHSCVTGCGTWRDSFEASVEAIYALGLEVWQDREITRMSDEEYAAFEAEEDNSNEAEVELFNQNGDDGGDENA